MAAEEITTELAPGSVELRLRGRDPEFVVTPPPADPFVSDLAEGEDTATGRPATGIAPHSTEGDEATMSRINLRLPDHLKARIEQVAGFEGLSVNAWLVRAAAAALTEPTQPVDANDAPRKAPSAIRAGRASRGSRGWIARGPMAAGAPHDPQEELDAYLRYPRTDLRHLGGRRR